jgi:DNA-binding response OmpR family regulator
MDKTDRMEILIVEDDESVRHLLSDALNNRGYKTIVCDNAESAWVQWQKQVYSLVIVDWLVSYPAWID